MQQQEAELLFNHILATSKAAHITGLFDLVCSASARRQEEEWYIVVNNVRINNLDDWEQYEHRRSLRRASIW